MNKHVTSLELSKKLKEAGVKQVSEFNWIQYPDKSKPLIRQLSEEEWDDLAEVMDFDKKGKPKFVSAFLTDELLEKLTHLDVQIYRTTGTDKIKRWSLSVFANGPRHCMPNKSLPEAAGQMLLWVKENKYVEA